MAQYYTDFSEYSIASAYNSQGWSARFSNTGNGCSVVAGGTGDRQLRLALSSQTYIRGHSIDVIDSDINRAKTEILAKFKSKKSSSNADMGLFVRGSGTTYLNAYGYWAEMVGGSSFRLVKAVNGTRTTLATYSYSYVADESHWIRFRVNGTSLSAKIWGDGESEPASWRVTATDSSISAAGWCGIAYSIGETLTDILSIATNGDVAGVAPTLTTDTATNIEVTGATLNANITDSDGENCDRYFEYGTTTAYGIVVDVGEGGEGAYSSNISGLNVDTTYHFRAYATNSTGTAYGEDRTFTTLGTYEPSSLNPNSNEKINPLASNTFTWSKDALAVQTHYEVEYKKVADVSYTSTGAIASATLSHEFTAETFENDEEYQWRVKSYDSANPTWYDWSPVATFNTINPPTLSAQTLLQGNEINVGALQVSAVITSIYSRQCFLTVLVSKNSDFSDSTSDFTALQDSGETFTVSVVFPYPGLWYVKYTGEDSTGLQVEQSVTVDVTRTLCFIDEPSISIQSPQATHVTVRVKDSDPVVEHTANTIPEAGANDKIERLVEIDSGTASVCQTVAEQLIARWGREQKSISGDIDLTVTLSFKEKIHIIDVQSGINSEFILQEKFHNVGEMTTRITVGDIILDDSELLARILDKLK